MLFCLPSPSERGDISQTARPLIPKSELVGFNCIRRSDEWCIDSFDLSSLQNYVINNIQSGMEVSSL